MRSEHPGGDNWSIFDKMIPDTRPLAETLNETEEQTEPTTTARMTLPANPIADFVTRKDSFLDFVKDGVFMYGHWVTITMVLVAGLGLLFLAVSRIRKYFMIVILGGQSLFALGYLIAAFVFLWRGNDLVRF